MGNNDIEIVKRETVCNEIQKTTPRNQISVYLGTIVKRDLTDYLSYLPEGMQYHT